MGLDDVLQPIGRKGIVADELDRAHAGLVAFGDREDQVDPIVRLLDDFRGDADVIAAGTAIDFGDPQRVGLHHRARQRAARLRLHLGLKLLVLDLLVALEGDAADDRVFDHADHDPAAGLVDLDVLEQAGLDQRLQRVVDLALVEPTARTGSEIGADGFDLNPPVALDHDRSRSSERPRATCSAPSLPSWQRAQRKTLRQLPNLPAKLAFQASCATRPCHSNTEPRPADRQIPHFQTCL